MDYTLIETHKEWDIIGDVHGHFIALAQLLNELGYTQQGGIYRHPHRKALFLGDLIDRGPDILGTLQLVNAMCDAGEALCIMGNHEYNALCYHTPSEHGSYLRAHTEKNQNQLSQTHKQFEQSDQSIDTFLSWFYSLPLYIEMHGFRAVHACWQQTAINTLAPLLDHHHCISPAVLPQLAAGGTEAFDAIEATLKGPEASLPSGYSFTDKDGHRRKEVRLRWWLNNASSPLAYFILPDLTNNPEVKNELLQASEALSLKGYGDTKPVFFGHYWLQGMPHLTGPRAACLDFSIAKQGHLVCYRYDGESKLQTNKLVWVSHPEAAAYPQA